MPLDRDKLEEMKIEAERLLGPETSRDLEQLSESLEIPAQASVMASLISAAITDAKPTELLQASFVSGAAFYRDVLSHLDPDAVAVVDKWLWDHKSDFSVMFGDEG